MEFHPSQEKYALGLNLLVMKLSRRFRSPNRAGNRANVSWAVTGTRSSRSLSASVFAQQPLNCLIFSLVCTLGRLFSLVVLIAWIGERESLGF